MDAFRKRMLEAVRDTRADSKEIKKRIGRLYEKTAHELAEEALSARSGLTEKFKRQLSENMREKVQGIWKEVRQETLKGMQRSAERAISAQAKALASVKPEDLSLAWRIGRVFGSLSEKAVKSVYNGSIYSGKHTTLSKRIWNNSKLQEGAIEQVIAEGVAKKLSAVQLADKLEAFVNPKAAMPTDWWDVYPNLPFCKATDYNAKRLAVTSINHAHWQAALLGARENPFVDIFHWELTDLHTITDICDEWAAHDEGLGEGNFKLDNAPCPHPWCTCLYYADTTRSADDIARGIGEWVKGEEEKLEQEAGLSVGEIETGKVVETFAYNVLKPVLNTAVNTADYKFIGEVADEVIVEAVKPLNPKVRGTRVILTSERKKHIIDRRGEKIFAKIAPHFTSTVENPDIVLEYKEKDLRFLRFLNARKDEAVVLVLKFAKEGDPEYMKHSIMQGIYASNDKLDKFLNKRKLYVKRLDKK